KKTQMVFLVDEYGGVEGLVTLQDVVDELVGEIGEAKEQLDRPNTTTTDGADGRTVWVVPGDTPIHEVARLLTLSGWAGSEPVVTVGGLFTARLRRFFRGGDEIEVEGVKLRALSADKAASRIEITAPPTPPNASAASDAA
ncbi:MAG: hypothetical protein M3463_18290, partial [Verrucomicrobiota bacterium]|nr:hypothetical protein [Verrucomicrobiota bacterium]